MTADATYARVPGAVDRVFRGRALVVGADGGGHRLEGMAAIAWIALGEPGDLAEVQSRLVEISELVIVAITRRRARSARAMWPWPKR